MAGTFYVQYTDKYASEAEARLALDFMSQQEDFCGGRVLPHTPEKPGWRIQTFHDDCGAECAGTLPDGCRRVLVLDSMRGTMGLGEARGRRHRYGGYR